MMPSGSPRLPPRLAWLLAALATYAALSPMASGRRPQDASTVQHQALGAALLRAELPPAGLRPGYRMPLAALSAHAGARLPPALWDGARRAAAALLLVTLAGALGGVWSAPGAALLWSLSPLGRGAWGEHVQPLYALAVLAVALALARRARAPGPESSMLLAVALGTSLLVRSPLVFFAPLLLAAEARRARPRRLDAALLLLGPVLLLVPWAWMNWRLEGRLVALEAGAAANNLVAGALGMTGTFEGDVRGLLPSGLDPGSGAPLLRWALFEAVGHPSRTAAGLLMRLVFCLVQAPIPFALAAAAAWRGRRDPAAAAVAGLAAYLLAAHAALGVQAGYVLPIAALACALAADLGRRLVLDASPAPPPETGAWPARAAAALSAAACVAASAFVLRYGWRAPRAAAVVSVPPEAVTAREAASTGDHARAVAALSAALARLRREARVRSPGDAAARAALADPRRLHEGLLEGARRDPPALRVALARAWLAADGAGFWGRLLLATSERESGRAATAAAARRAARGAAWLPAHRRALLDECVAAEDLDCAAPLAGEFAGEAHALDGLRSLEYRRGQAATRR